MRSESTNALGQPRLIMPMRLASFFSITIGYQVDGLLSGDESLYQ
jgi:hypothetical protein